MSDFDQRLREQLHHMVIAAIAYRRSLMKQDQFISLLSRIRREERFVPDVRSVGSDEIADDIADEITEEAKALLEDDQNGIERTLREILLISPADSDLGRILCQDLLPISPSSSKTFPGTGNLDPIATVTEQDPSVPSGFDPTLPSNGLPSDSESPATLLEEAEDRTEPTATVDDAGQPVPAVGEPTLPEVSDEATLLHEPLRDQTDINDEDADRTFVPSSDVESTIGTDQPLAHSNQDNQTAVSQSAESASGVLGNPEAGRYILLHKHARGGLGEVAVALDRQLHRKVALKRIREQFASQSASCDRFIQEAEITGLLEHPGIVPIYGLGKDIVGRPFYTMRFILGESLQEAIDKHIAEEHSTRHAWLTSVRRLLRHFTDICNTIAYAHNRSVIHRDLKPENVMLGAYGETLVVDWGLAKVLDRDGPTGSVGDAIEGSIDSSQISGGSHTIAGRAIGTPTYMSPEQATGRIEDVGTATDIFSLGAILYCILTGKAPYFDDAGLQKILKRASQCEFPSPRTRNPWIPLPLEAICLKAMSRHREERYENARMLAEEIEHWMADEPISARQDTVLERIGRLTRRYRTAVVVGIVALVVIVIGAISSAISIDKERNTAVTAERKATHLFLEKAKLADDNAELAEEQKRARLRVEKQLRISNALRLASLSRLVPDYDSIDRLLLANEATAVTTRVGEPLLTTAHQALRDGLDSVSGIPLQGHTDTVTCVAVNFESNCCITGSLDRTARVWRISAGEERHLQTLFHGSQLQTVAFSPDGRKAVTGATDGTLKLWLWASLDDPPVENELLQHSREVRQVVFSEDGKWLATAGGNTISLWPVDHLDQPPRQLNNHTNPVSALEFSPDGQTLFSAGADRRILQWSLTADQSEEPLREFKGHRGPINDLSVSPDGETLYSCGSDRQVIRWKITEEESAPELLTRCRGVALGLAASSDGRWLAVGDESGDVIWWDLSADATDPTQVVSGHPKAIRSLRYLPGKDSLVTSSDDGTCRLWSMSDRNPVMNAEVLRGHEGKVVATAVSPDGHWLVSASEDRSARLWDVAQGTPVSSGFQLPRHDMQVSENAISRDGQWVATASWDKTIGLSRINEVGTPVWDGLLTGHSGFVSSVAFDPQNQWLASGGWDKEVRVWRLDESADTGDSILLSGHRQLIKQVSFSRDGQRLFSADAGGLVRVWQMPEDPAAEVVLLHELDQQQGVIETMQLSRDEQFLATAGEDRTVRIWDLQADPPAVRISWNAHDRTIRRLVFTATGDRLITGSADKTVRIWKWPTEDPLADVMTLEGITESVTDLVVSPDDRWLLVSDAGNRAFLYDLKRAQHSVPARVLVGHSAAIDAVGITLDSRWAVTAGRDRSARVWDLEATASDAAAVVISGHQQSILALAVEGTRVVTSGRDGRSWLWDVDPQVLRDRALIRAGRDLTAEERQKYELPEVPADEPGETDD